MRYPLFYGAHPWISTKFATFGWKIRKREGPGTVAGTGENGKKKGKKDAVCPERAGKTDGNDGKSRLCSGDTAEKRKEKRKIKADSWEIRHKR